MKKQMLIVSAMLLAGASAAMAQGTPTVPGYPDVKIVPVDRADAATPAGGASLRQKLSADLVSAGYQDINIQPEAFIVRAKNKAGEPVTMFLSPDSMTVFTAVDSKGQDEKAATAAPAPRAPTH